MTKDWVKSEDIFHSFWVIFPFFRLISNDDFYSTLYQSWLCPLHCMFMPEVCTLFLCYSSWSKSRTVSGSRTRVVIVILIVQMFFLHKILLSSVSPPLFSFCVFGSWKSEQISFSIPEVWLLIVHCALK